MATNNPNFEKVPSDQPDYKMDWRGSIADGGPFLEDGETISSSSWTITEPDGESPVQLSQESESNTNDDATIQVSGGTVNKTYRCTNTIQTSLGRTWNKTLQVSIKAFLPE